MRLIVLIAALGLGAAAHAGGDARVAEGRAFAEEHCARCHAVGATGPSPNAEAPAFRTFQDKWPLVHLEEALGEGIVVGHPDMPEFELDPAEIDALLAYLASLPSGSQ